MADQRLDELDSLARGLVEILFDPQAKTPAERTEKRNQARDKLLEVLDAINSQAQASQAQAMASEAYCLLLGDRTSADQAHESGPSAAKDAPLS